LQANVGQSFRIPSFLELYIPTGTQLAKPDLERETATFVEGGASVAGRVGSLRVAGFAAQYRDLIVYEYQPPLASRPYNLGTSNAWGLEVEARLQPAPWIEASGSYALLFTEDIRDIPAYFGKEVPYRPRHRGTARLAVGPEWLRLHATVRGQSRMWVNRTNTIALAGRVMLDAGVDLRLFHRPTVVLSLWGTNLTGVEARDLDAYPLPGRALYAALTVRFGDAPSPAFPSSGVPEALPCPSSVAPSPFSWPACWPCCFRPVSAPATSSARTRRCAAETPAWRPRPTPRTAAAAARRATRAMSASPGAASARPGR